MSEYTLTRAGDELTERERLALLQSYQDPTTFRYLTEAGVTTGWHCLDVGAGGGSITRWLADRVGPTGSVLATDIETDLLSQVDLPNVTVQRHTCAPNLSRRARSTWSMPACCSSAYPNATTFSYG
ncbi:MAG TPA: hypothetical protein VGD84_23630 [Pseudonocardiaceae bacterium]